MRGAEQHQTEHPSPARRPPAPPTVAKPGGMPDPSSGSTGGRNVGDCNERSPPACGCGGAGGPPGCAAPGPEGCCVLGTTEEMPKPLGASSDRLRPARAPRPPAAAAAAGAAPRGRWWWRLRRPPCCTAGPV
jgi:hypothetical protein